MLVKLTQGTHDQEMKGALVRASKYFMQRNLTYQTNYGKTGKQNFCIYIMPQSMAHTVYLSWSTLRGKYVNYG
jgi:hypothetical protein